jgi:restriction endonuclease S subunit
MQAQASRSRLPIFEDTEQDGGKKNHTTRKYTMKTRKNKSKNKKSKKRWSLKYKKSINCKRPRGFSQRQYCKYDRKKS